VLSLDEVAKDPQAEAIGLFPEIESPEAGTYRTVRIPMRIPTAQIGPKGPSPAVGAHTAAVLEGLGRSAADVDALVAAGIVKGEDA
jgi:crotonobetainyl-CoA:carnitine CoA-transferase CaiB-like acyl-CoA transferase